MKMIIVNKPDEYDSNSVRWINELEDNTEIQIGFGYQSRDDGRIHIKKCPKCHYENYALHISEGSCFKCDFDPNKKEGGEVNGTRNDSI